MRTHAGNFRSFILMTMLLCSVTIMLGKGCYWMHGSECGRAREFYTSLVHSVSKKKN